MPSRKVEDLLPELQVLFHEFTMKMHDEGIQFIVTCTKRSSEEQKELYAQGRTKPGKVVTWTINSKHCEGKAFDIVLIENNQACWDAKKYTRAGELGESVGLVWGGRWKKPDAPHFQLKEG
jgi:peptidoglycan L-alanyl-D-glutamate endopeptidase CwlK